MPFTVDVMIMNHEMIKDIFGEGLKNSPTSAFVFYVYVIVVGSAA